LLSASAQPAFAIGLPIERFEGYWMPTVSERVQITRLRVNVVPSLGADGEDLLWLVDETMVLRNQGTDHVDLNIGIPNAWSNDTARLFDESEPFWAEAYVNGQRVRTQIADLIRNPAIPFVEYRTVRRFEVALDPGEAAHVRLRFALPASTSDAGEVELALPFHLRPLWNGPVESGQIVVLWTDRMFGLRSNLGAYAQYEDRIEWFVHAFEPETDLELRFLPRSTVFQLVARDMGCPMPWEVVDRVSEGNPEHMQTMLAPYPLDRLRICASLPAALRGSAAAATETGLDAMTLDQYAPLHSGVTGPVWILNPEYDPEDLSDLEAIYVRFLRQEVANR
jgi:hypothetical protein